MSRANKRWFHKKSIFQNKNRVGKSAIQGNMFSKKRTNWKKIILISMVLLVLGILVVWAYCFMTKLSKTEAAKIEIQVADAIIYQDTELPDIEVQVKYPKENRHVLDFLDEFYSANAYQIYSEGDLSKEGQYKLLITWNEEIEKKLERDWADKLKVEIRPGTLTVKNKVGEWEKDRFKKRDGTYAAEEFLVINGEEFYFDQDGKKVTGEYKINGVTYYFTEDGIFDKEKNKFHPNKPKVALTFDDGPGKYTEDLLTILEENDARATFFVLGQQVKSFPTAVKRMKEIGCEIGNHTYSHRRLTDLSKKDMKSQIDKTNEALKEIIGEGTKLVRPTYGDVNASVRKYVKYPLIMWSLDTEDWKVKDSKKIAETILSQIEEGDIILMHDIHDFTFEAMKTVIPELVERGYQLVTVSELAEWKDIDLEKGTKYFEF